MKQSWKRSLCNPGISSEKKGYVPVASLERKFDTAIPIADSAEILGIAVYINRCPIRIPAGKLVRAAIARAVIHNDDFILRRGKTGSGA
jgi:ABC-type sugar transport system ATPase subunit